MRESEAAFTLIEALIGLMVLVLAAGGVFYSLMQMNRMASVARLYTAAQFIVQSQIDTIQNDSPFDPQLSGTGVGSVPIPGELALGTTSSTGIPVYVDPATGNTQVTGTMTRTVSNISTTSLNEYAYMATVQLAYTYRGRTYQVIESTVRGSDE